MPEWDVIVVGAGPAGLSAARWCAGEGLKTLIFEAKGEIKAWKPCGEGISRETLKTAEIDPTPDFISNELGMRVYAPNGNYVDLGQTGYAINKDMFLYRMAVAAAEQGAEFKMFEPVKTVLRENGKMVVKTTRGTYDAILVIGADGIGPNSTVARSLGMDNKVEIIPCVQYKMACCNVEDENGRIYLGRSVAPLGYAWIFPKGGGVANVGLGVRGEPAMPYLQRFVESHKEIFKDAKIIGFGSAPVPIGGMAKEITGDGVILIGDAAGTVIPFTGAGIHSSIAAGKIASKVAAEAVSQEDSSKSMLQKFEQEYDKYWGKRIKSSLKAMRVFEKLGDEDFNMLANILTAEDIINLANGINILKTATKLLKHPVLAAKLARPLLGK
ncbi:MAG TPA: NAD(P)/FAD-dependent oxidoreductase [Candidatus Bathyarchaeota archaeon]|nr:NAD(P)/FAD-dependent oxidoreductase [Candidatus Bathyarchaeota archaeon]